MLANQGYKVLHLTRHCGMEHGKDVIAIDQDGNVCAYQLKAVERKVKLKQWIEELNPQLMQLVFTPVSHPSVPTSTAHHKSFFVTNGELEEEVSAAIKAFNDDWVAKGHPHYSVNPILKGDLLKWANELKSDFIPVEVTDLKSLLEFFLSDGKTILEKDKFNSLLFSHFNVGKLKVKALKRIVSSGAMLCSLAISKFEEQSNHIAVIEAWVIYLAHVFWLIDGHGVQQKHFQDEIDLAEMLIENRLHDLKDEIGEIGSFLLGNPVQDMYVVRYRITYVAGYLAYLGIQHFVKGRREEAAEIASVIIGFVGEQHAWGEAAVPFQLMVCILLKLVQHAEAEKLFRVVMAGLITIHQNPDTPAFNPYYDVDQAVSTFLNREVEDISRYDSSGHSFYLESLMYLAVSWGEKDFLQQVWPHLTKIYFERHEPKVKADWFLRRAEGIRHTYSVNALESWSKLQADIKGSASLLPDSVKTNHLLYPLLLFVLPQRIYWSDMVDWQTQISSV